MRSGLFKLDIKELDSHKGKASQVKLGDIQVQSVGLSTVPSPRSGI